MENYLRADCFSGEKEVIVTTPAGFALVVSRVSEAFLI